MNIKYKSESKTYILIVIGKYVLELKNQNISNCALCKNSFVEYKVLILAFRLKDNLCEFTNILTNSKGYL